MRLSKASIVLQISNPKFKGGIKILELKKIEGVAVEGFTERMETVEDANSKPNLFLFHIP